MSNNGWYCKVNKAFAFGLVRAQHKELHAITGQCAVQAKTIDLCNNPKTKEPKLTAARRIISEWPALDAEQVRVGASTY